MQTRTILGLFALSLLAIGPAVGQEKTQDAEPEKLVLPDIPPELKEAAVVVVEGTNELRRKNDLQPVSRNRELDKAAEYFARVLAATQQFSHQADGKCPTIRAGEHGYQACFVTENIAYYGCPLRPPPKEVARRFLSVWDESPPHRTNMLDPDVIHVGIGIARNEESGRCYAVQMFGRPRDRMLKFQVTNHSRSAVEYKVDEQTFQLPPRYTQTHQHCRTPKLALPGPEGGEPFRPGEGDTFLISDDENGGHRMERQPRKQ